MLIKLLYPASIFVTTKAIILCLILFFQLIVIFMKDATFAVTTQ